MKQTRPFCLASGSPRRQELLAQFGFLFETHVVDVDERKEPEESPAQYVIRLASLKAEMARHRFGDHLILAGDTTVCLDDMVLGKPEDSIEATSMIARLSGKTHQVLSAYHLLDTASGESASGINVTDVTFRSLPQSWIDWYGNHTEPLDKAGAYGIQGVGGAMIERIEGSYNTVVGFPIESILWEMVNRGWVTL